MGFNAWFPDDCSAKKAVVKKIAPEGVYGAVSFKPAGGV